MRFVVMIDINSAVTVREILNLYLSFNQAGLMARTENLSFMEKCSSDRGPDNYMIFRQLAVGLAFKVLV